MVSKKILVLLDLSESYSRRLLKGLIKYSDLNGPWSFCKLPHAYKDKYGLDKLIEFAIEWKADAIIGQFKTEKEVDALLDKGIKVIAMDYTHRFESFSNITGNYIKSGQMAAEYFLAKGFKHFAYYGFSPTVWSQERNIGFRKILSKSGFEAELYKPKSKTHTDFWYYKPSPLVKWLKNLKKPVAVFASDDNGAEHLLQAAKIADLKVPHDIAILGVDNDEMTCTMSSVSLSSIEQDELNAGFKVGALFQKMFSSNSNIKADIYVEPLRIITRQSTDLYTVDDPLVKDALAYMDENINSNLKVNDIAKKLAVSRRVLEKRFIRSIEKPLYQTIQQKKSDKVADLLLSTNLSVNEIAAVIGYEDASNLSRSFKKYFNLTPLQFRKKYQPIK